MLSTLALTVLVVALGVTATVLVTRRILGPVELLVQATRQIAAGNLVARVDAQASGEIGELAGSSVDLAQKAGHLREAIVPSIKKTADLVQEISAASEEQSSGVGHINLAMNQLSQLTQQNASASEQLAATSEEMSGQAQKLQQIMSFFKVGTTGADSPMRSAAGTQAKSPVLEPVKRGRKPNGHDHAGKLDVPHFVQF